MSDHIVSYRRAGHLKRRGVQASSDQVERVLGQHNDAITSRSSCALSSSIYVTDANTDMNPLPSHLRDSIYRTTSTSTAPSSSSHHISLRLSLPLLVDDSTAL